MILASPKTLRKLFRGPGVFLPEPRPVSVPRITIQAAGPGSGCHGENCGRPSLGPKPLPGPAEHHHIEEKEGRYKVTVKHQWTPETRVGYVKGMGRSWVDKIVAGDNKLQSQMSKVKDIEQQYNETKQKADKLGEQLNQYWNSKLNDRWQATNKKMVQEMERSTQLFNQRLELNKQISDRIISKISTGPVEPSRSVRLSIEDSSYTKFSPSQRSDISQAVQAVDRLIGGAPTTAKSIAISPAEATHGAGFSRSYFNERTNSIHLATTYAPIVWHEMGHWIEHNVPGGKEAALSYLDSRTKGEEAKPLKEIDPKKPSYEDWEVSKKDKFLEPYVGKVYQSGATELTSMGLQMLKEDPAKFFRQDRDHFEFTLGMIRAAQAGGFPWAKEKKV